MGTSAARLSTVSCGRFRLFSGRRFRGLFTYRQAQRALHVTLDALQHFRLILQSLLRVLASLAQAFALVRKPRAALFHYAIIRSQIEQVAFARNAFAVHYVELGLAERRRDFVLRHLHLRAIADDAVAVLDRADATDVEAHRRIELESATAARGFGIAEHHTNLLANLVDEDKARARLRHDRRQLAQRL